MVKEQYLGGHIDHRLYQCKETKTTQKRLASDGGSICEQHSYSGGLVGGLNLQHKLDPRWSLISKGLIEKSRARKQSWIRDNQVLAPKNSICDYLR